MAVYLRFSIVSVLQHVWNLPGTAASLLWIWQQGGYKILKPGWQRTSHVQKLTHEVLTRQFAPEYFDT
eukprot:5177544-Amphidinium_carterae.1